MPSPFPGMDPYIEAYGDWADFNACFATCCCDSLNDQLPQKVDVYAWSVRQKLPVIPIPLLPPDADVPIDLAVLVNQVYDRGRYGQLIAYDKPTPKGINEADFAWTEQLASRARR